MTIRFPFKLPFVRRSKYERVKADMRDFRRACDVKQKVLMHYKDRYTQLSGALNYPRDKIGRFIGRGRTPASLLDVMPHVKDELINARNRLFVHGVNTSSIDNLLKKLEREQP